MTNRLKSGEFSEARADVISEGAVRSQTVPRHAAPAPKTSASKPSDCVTGKRLQRVPNESHSRMAEKAPAESGPAATCKYKPMFFHPQCPGEKYYGWRFLYEEPGVRIVRKRLGVFSKTLFMCQDVDEERLSLLVKDRRFGGPTEIQIVHDFSRPANEARLTLGGRRFDHCQKDRLLNIGTFVIDLGEPEEKLWRNLAPNSRTKVRRAAKEGVEIRVSSHPNKDDLRIFFEFYRPLAKRVGLDIPSQELVERMIDSGDMISAAAVAPDSTVVAVNLIYLCPPYAYDVWGASASDRINGVGHLLRWETTRWLKNRGFRWYDLGGAATTDPSDPIYSFKKTLGGRYVSLGSEYRRMSELTKSAYAVFRLAKKHVRHLSPRGR